MARKAPSIPLPRGWSEHVKAAIVHVISLAQVAFTTARAATKQPTTLVVRFHEGSAAKGTRAACIASHLPLRLCFCLEYSIVGRYCAGFDLAESGFGAHLEESMQIPGPFGFGVRSPH